MLSERRLELLEDVTTGTFRRSDELPPDVRRAIEPRLECSPQRRTRLQEILRRENPSIADLWPYLKLLSTWTGGSCGIALETVRASLPRGTRVGELGYLSSEFLGTITIDLDSNRGVPTLQDNVLEFVERDLWDRDVSEFLGSRSAGG